MGWLAALGAIGRAVWPIIKPLVGPFIAYWKGRREGAERQRAKAEKRYNDAVEKAGRARGRVDPDGVHDDPYNRDT